VGARTVEQERENAAAGRAPLATEDLRAIADAMQRHPLAIQSS